MNKTKSEVQTVLTVDELKRMGKVLVDLKETIELYNCALNLVPSGDNIKAGMLELYYQSLYDLTKTMFYKNQNIVDELDDIGYALLENTDAIEIENTKKV